MTIKQKELRTLSFETRDLSFDDKSLKVSGYVNKAGSYSQVMSADGTPFRETILPQAFVEAVATEDPIDFYAEHDDQKLLATTVNHSLMLRADDNGLYMEAQILDTNDGRDTYELIKSGVITSMSFGFIVLDDDWDMTGGNFDDGIPLRTVKEIILKEVSAVRFPAYLSSSIEARGIQELKQLEHRGINSVSEVVNIKEGNELELRDVETKELFAELERRAKLPANKVIVKPAKRDDEPDTTEPQVASGVSGTVDALSPVNQIDVDELSKQIVASVLAGIQTSLAQRDGEEDVPEPDGSDMATDDDTQTDSMKPAKSAKSDEKRDDEPDDSDEPDDGSDDETETDSKTSKKDSKSAEKRSMEARELLKQINDLEV
ncbi:prohead protease [Lactiplantibacillus phage Gut-P1]|nr:prohead protease [Lactiplantibacillus phage Gut-P1]